MADYAVLAKLHRRVNIVFASPGSDSNLFIHFHDNSGHPYMLSGFKTAKDLQISLDLVYKTLFVNILEMLELRWHSKQYLLADKLSGDRIKQVMEHIWKLQEFCNSMAKLDIDGYEYAYLKAIVLFSPGKEFGNYIFFNSKP